MGDVSGLCCSGLLGRASGDAGLAAANGSIFRAQPRMFFSSCSGGPLREKLRSFWRDLREFSRTAVGRDGRRVGVGGSFAGKRVAVRRWLRAGRGWRWRPVWQGLQRLLAATLTIEMHSVAIGRRRGMSTTPRPRPTGSRAHRSIAQFFEWRGGRDVHICVGMRWACFDAHRRNSQRGEWVSAGDIHIGEGVSRRSAARLRRSNAQGREWVSRLERRAETCMPGNCRLALMVEVRWVASGFISRTDAPDPACCTIAGGRSTWKCFGSRVGYLPERHAGTRMLRNREPALSVETYWVASGIIRRTGALVHACRAIAALFVEMLWVASGFIGRTCTPQRAYGTIAPRSPLKYTGLRVSATVVIPARSGLADQPRGHPHR